MSRAKDFMAMIQKAGGAAGGLSKEDIGSMDSVVEIVPAETQETATLNAETVLKNLKNSKAMAGASGSCENDGEPESKKIKVVDGDSESEEDSDEEEEEDSDIDEEEIKKHVEMEIGLGIFDVNGSVPADLNIPEVLVAEGSEGQCSAKEAAVALPGNLKIGEGAITESKQDKNEEKKIEEVVKSSDKK